jgi:hypothetical protein
MDNLLHRLDRLQDRDLLRMKDRVYRPSTVEAPLFPDQHRAKEGNNP